MTLPNGTIRALPLRGMARIRASVARNRWLVADQALVSAMNFLTSAMLARMLGIYYFGLFSVFYVVLQYLNVIQQAVVIGPMMTMAPQIRDFGKQNAFLSGVATFQYLFSAACCLLALLGTLFSRLRFVTLHVDRVMIAPYVLAVFFFQVQDWYRRRCYVYEDGREVFWNDVISYVGQVAALLLLWHFRHLNVAAAFFAIAITSAIAFAVASTRTNLAGSAEQMRSILPRVWDMGRKLLVASQFQWAGSQGVMLIIAIVVGVKAIGGTRAATTLIGPIIVLFQLIDNVVPVRAARIYSEQGHDRLVHYLRHTALELAILVGSVVVAGMLVAKPLMAIVFGKSYTGFAVLFFWQGAGTWIGVFLRILQYYYRTIGKAHVLAGVSSFASLVSLCAAVGLARKFGAAGAIAGVVMGQTLSVIVLSRLAKGDAQNPLFPARGDPNRENPDDPQGADSTASFLPPQTSGSPPISGQV